MPEFSIQRTGAPGARSGTHPAIPGADIPYAIVEGASPGPCLVITAGIHASEYCSIQAATEIMRMDPMCFSGCLVVLPIMNASGFKARSIYVVPEDGKNLNRQFPGRSDGSHSERLAHWFVSAILPHADAYIDLHGGDMSEELIPFTIHSIGHSASRILAQEFGLPIVVASHTHGNTIGAASERGIPSILAEVGGNGRWTRAGVETLKDGVRRVMHHLGMLKVARSNDTSPRDMTISAPTARQSGLWYPEKGLSDGVAVGDHIGTIRDVFGKELQAVYSEVDGRVLYRLVTLSVNEGEQLMGIGVDALE